MKEYSYRRNKDIVRIKIKERTYFIKDKVLFRKAHISI